MKIRNPAIDIMKGLLVVGMIWTHSLQFFAYNTSVLANVIETVGNVTSFAGFLFCFGFGNQAAYFSRRFSQACGRMIRTALKILIAFYISGTFFRIFISQTPVAWPPIRNIILLNDIPGWSEFLAGFFAMTVVAIVFFRPLQWLIERRTAFWIVFFALFLSTWIPYENVTSAQLGLLVGTRQFASFPVLQYFPYYLLGMYFCRYQVVFSVRLAIGSIIGSAAFVFYLIRSGQQPSRFPPSIEWISSSMAIDYLYYLAARGLTRWRFPTALFSSVGRNVLLYLLVGNICLFTLKSVAGGYLYLTPWQCGGLAVILMMLAAYFTELTALNRRGTYSGGSNFMQTGGGSMASCEHSTPAS